MTNLLSDIVPMRPLRHSGTFLLVLGLVHLAIFLASGTEWEGDISWRKATLFGISTGLTLWSLGAVWSIVQPRRRDAYLIHATAYLAVIEVLIITIQMWRGVPSHFNHSTLLDTAMHYTMDLCIALVAFAVADLTFRLFGNVRSTAVMTYALRRGMVLLLISCVIGFLILFNGFVRQAQGLPPSLIGAAGVPKFAHGVAIHAVQWLPLIAWGLNLGGLPVAMQWRLVRAAELGSWGLLAYSAIQSLSGSPRVATGLPQQSLLAVSTLLILVPNGIAFLSAGLRYVETLLDGRRLANES